jgi:hypothetical protein
VRRTVWIAAGLLALRSSHAGAQVETRPAPPGETPPPSLSAAGSMEVAANLWAVIGRYRYAATADRVRVTLVRPGGRSDMLSLIVRCVPGASGLARLELGELTLVAQGGRLLAVHGRDPTTYAELQAPQAGADPASVLRALLPPLAIPQLSLAFDPAEVEWCPLVRGLAWENAERVAIGGHDGVRLSGRTETGAAAIELAGARVRRFEADLEAGGQTRLIVECEPLEPGDPAGWGVDLSGRRRVSGLAALQPLGPAIAVGDPFPRLRVVTVASPDERVLGVEPQPGLFPESRYYAALLVRDDLPAETTRAAAEAAISGITELRRELLRGRLDGRLDKRVRFAELVGVVQAQTTEGMLERVAQQSGAWLAAVEPVAEAERPVLAWTGGEGRLIDRFAPGAAAVVVLYDGAGVIRAIVPLDGRPTADAVAAGLIGGVAGISRASQ